MNYKKAYINFLQKYIHIKRPLKVVFDVSNGPAGMLIKDLWHKTGVEAILINDKLDPDFKAHGPNPLLPGASKSCAQTIKKYKADLGVMFDADGDRAFFLDEKGEMLPACFVAILLCNESKPPYVADELVYQSLRLLKAVSNQKLVSSRIGAYFIKEKMREQKATFGAEYSGHYYFKDFFNADSGLFVSIQFVNMFSGMEQSLSEWKASFGEHSIITTEIETAGKDMKLLYRKLENVYTPQALRVDKRDGLTFVFDSYWINTRSSNTEPIMRIISGGTGDMHEKRREIQKLIEEN
jgi:phosphomannomutase